MTSTENDIIENRMTRQVFYADVRMTRNLFVAEWDKKLFLNGLEEARGLFRVEVYAFCVLDDRFRMLVGGLDVKSRTVRRLVSTALEHMHFFLAFVEQYAKDIGDDVRPYSLETWESAFKLWKLSTCAQKITVGQSVF